VRPCRRTAHISSPLHVSLRTPRKGAGSPARGRAPAVRANANDTRDSAQLKAARGEIARVDGKVDSLDKALRAELREVDERHTRNHEANSARIHVLELEKDALREEIAAMKPRISTLEKDTQELQSTVGEHGVR
jgi:chromosome segregation ATPase